MGLRSTAIEHHRENQKTQNHGERSRSGTPSQNAPSASAELKASFGVACTAWLGAFLHPVLICLHLIIRVNSCLLRSSNALAGIASPVFQHPNASPRTKPLSCSPIAQTETLNRNANLSCRSLAPNQSNGQRTKISPAPNDQAQLQPPAAAMRLQRRRCNFQGKGKLTGWWLLAAAPCWA